MKHAVCTFPGSGCATKRYRRSGEGKPRGTKDTIWETDRLNQWITVEPNEVILIEGVYASGPELRPLIDIAIVVETLRDERRKRMLTRGYLKNDIKNDWLAPWMAAEDWYFANVRPAQHADLIVMGI